MWQVNGLFLDDARGCFVKYCIRIDSTKRVENVICGKDVAGVCWKLMRDNGRLLMNHTMIKLSE